MYLSTREGLKVLLIVVVLGLVIGLIVWAAQ